MAVMTTLAIIVAAGRGARAGDGPPKQYRLLGGETVLRRAVRAFAEHPRIDRIRVAIREEDRARYEEAVAGLEKIEPPVIGGAERQETVRLALEAASPAPALALIHDAARPFVDAAVIDRTLESLRTHDGACVALPLSDTLRREHEGFCGELAPRDGLWRAQTPQGFHFGPILDAHRRFREHAVTDDAELARLAGMRVALVTGAVENLKLTTPEDFEWARRWVGAQSGGRDVPSNAGVEFRTGQGFDVHKFGPNADGSTDHVMLCGVAVPHDAGLVGHSDADVGLHALTDAILGAIGAGDIGAHFPPSDPQWRGASSDRFLAHAGALVRERAGRLTNVDVTLVCERPRIGPHVPAMRARIAEILDLDIDRVSVKATTSEGLGFTGRREGVAALASATAAL